MREKAEECGEEGEAEERDGETGGDFGTGSERGGEGGEPVEERRFFEPGRAPEGGGDPVAGAGHGATDGGVTWFIRTEQADSAEVEEVEAGGGEKEGEQGQITAQGGQVLV